MIHELLATALLAVSLNNGPKRTLPLNPYVGKTYSVNFKFTGPANVTLSYGDTNYTAGASWSGSNTIGNNNVSLHYEMGGYGEGCHFTLTFTIPDDFERERFGESWFQMQGDHSYTLDNGFVIDEFNAEYSYEVSFDLEWDTGKNYDGNARFTLPIMFAIDYQTFGTTENTGRKWVKQYDRFTKTFNAIYEDNTEPKLYAFWLSSYYLARQVRYNGDIINLNYVTSMDRLDGLFGKQCQISFTAQEDVNLQVSATPYDPSWELMDDYNKGYNAGFQEGKTEGQKPVSWIKTTFDGIAGFFNIQVFPFVTLGFLCFAPLIVVAIVAILRIIKHD